MRAASGSLSGPQSVRLILGAGGALLRRGALRLLLGGSGVVLALLLWQFAAGRAGSLFFPPPSAILGRAAELWLSGPAARLFLSDAVFEDVLPSLGRFFAGWGIAVALGVALGLLLGRSRRLEQYLDPSLQFLRAIPGPALVPVFLILLGTESTMRISLIAFGAVWPVLINTVEAMQGRDPMQDTVARAFRLPPAARLRHVILPAALPKIAAGARIALSIGLILMVVSEFVASTDGIGHHVSQAQNLYLLTDMWAGIVLLALLGFGLNAVFTAAERRLLRWHHQSNRRGDAA